MSGYQFIHVESYARIPSRTHKKQSARNIAREAERQPGACPHVSTPLPYKLMYGCKPSEAVDLAEKRAKVAVDSIGRKLRQDAQILLGGVVSYPVLISELTPCDKKLNKWLKLNFKFLEKKYGKALKSIVAHFDESSYFHLHFYVVPELDENGRMNIGDIHQGIKARDSLGGRQAKAKMRAYKESMRAYQDEYFDLVGKPCGLTREGANKRRLTRSEWKAEQVAAERLAQSLEQISFADAQSNALQHEKKLIAENKTELIHEQEKQRALIKKSDSRKRQVKAILNQYLQVKSEKNGAVRYLKCQMAKLKTQVSKLVKNLSKLEAENHRLKEEVSHLTKRKSELERISEKLAYQNEIKTKALKQDNMDMLNIVKLASMGKINEISDRYNKNNNKEYAL